MILKKCANQLETHFYIPNLTQNLRNASEVFNMVEVVKNENKVDKSDVKDTLGITTVAMTIHATTPKLIPIIDKERDQVLGDAILFAIKKTREHGTSEGSDAHGPAPTSKVLAALHHRH